VLRERDSWEEQPRNGQEKGTGRARGGQLLRREASSFARVKNALGRKKNFGWNLKIFK
jgi:hypothetical protein